MTDCLCTSGVAACLVEDKKPLVITVVLLGSDPRECLGCQLDVMIGLLKQSNIHMTNDLNLARNLTPYFHFLSRRCDTLRVS